MEKIEIEHKYLVKSFSPEILFKNKIPFETFHISQEYLTNIEKGVSERVRATTAIGGTKDLVYTHTIKRPATEGSLESDIEITEEEFLNLLKRKDSKSSPIIKYRYVFSYKLQTFELDSFVLPIQFHMMELEVDSLSRPVHLPEFLKLVEVTEFKEFANKRIALDGSKTLNKISTIVFKK